MSLTVRNGSIRIKIHRSPKRLVNRDGVARTFADWEFRWRDAGGRVRRLKRAKKQDAVAEARRIAQQLAEGKSGELSAQDEARFRASEINLIECGISIEIATAEYAEVRRRLGKTGTPIEAADFFVRHHATGGSDKSIAEVVEELLKARKSGGAGELHLEDLKSRLTRFANAVKCSIRQLNAPVINEWMGTLDLSPRSVQNYRAAVSNLIDFAIGKKYLPPGFAEMRFVTTPKSVENDVEIFTIDDMRQLLQNVTPSVLPVLVLGGFAGLRTSETRHICWEHVHWDKGLITVPKGKTGKRLAPLMDNTAEWLRSIRGAGQGGRIVRVTASTITNGMARAVSTANRDLPTANAITWKHNALRHSFVTYWSSFEHDLWKISERTGHSVRMLKRNYQRQDIFPETGRAWFEIRPDQMQLTLFDMGRIICPLPAPSEKPCVETAQNRA